MAAAQSKRSPQPSAASSQKPAPTVKHPQLSDRAQAGLHGPVKSCVEETEYLNLTPAVKLSITRAFDREGRLVETRTSDSRGVGSTVTFTYDAAGRLLSLNVVNPDGTSAQAETRAYDGFGRLLSIVRSGSREARSDFHYDERGRKTEVQSFAPERGPVAHGFEGQPMVGAQAGASLPEGGTVTTVYDEQDRPTEVQTRDAEGNLVTRVVRTYDVAGRASSEKEILENPQFLLPAPLRRQMLQSGASPAEVNEMAAKLFGGAQSSNEVLHVYDEQGRETEQREKSALGERVTTTSYDQHGNMLLQRTTRTAPPAASGQNQDLGFPLEPFQERRTRYVYDSFGNWTEATSSWRSSPDADFQDASATRRTLTYH